MRIMVLMGGSSPERMVSLASGEAVAEGLDIKGHQVLKMDPSAPEKVYTIMEKVFEGPVGEIPLGQNSPLTSENIAEILRSLKKYSVDLIFPMLHGGWGEDGRLQALFEIAGVPFVGSGSAASALAMNKHLAKRVVSTEGISTPEFFFLHKTMFDKAMELCEEFGYPLVVKPNHGGSTVGLTIVRNRASLKRAVTQVAELGDDMLVERYIPGRELTVGIFQGQGMSVVEIVPREGFYDYRHKYTEGQTEYVCPAEIGSELTNKCIEAASLTFRLMGCEIFGRVDFRLSKNGEIFFLEVNTIPGMTKHSLVPKSAAAVGMNFPELVNRIVVTSMNLKREFS